MAGTAVDKKSEFEISPPDGGGFEVSAPTPDMANESYMAAHPPTPKFTGVNPSYLGLAASNSPSGADPHNPGNPNLNAIPGSERGRVNDTALTTQLSSFAGAPFANAAVAGSAKPLIPIARSLVGMAAGKYIGHEAGGLVGHPEAGGTIGGLAGGIAGGFGKLPSKAALMESVFASPEAETLSPVGSPDNPAFHSKLPARLPASLRGDPFQPHLEPIEPTAPGVEAPTAKVMRLPIPREPLPGENPGSMASIPRARLLDLARQGRPGAADQLRNVGKTPLFVGESYPAPRSVESLEHVGGESELKQIERPTGTANDRPQYIYKPSEKAATMSDKPKYLGPEFDEGQITHDIERSKSILRNPRATAEDRAVAEDRLREMEERRRAGTKR